MSRKSSMCQYLLFQEVAEVMRSVPQERRQWNDEQGEAGCRATSEPKRVSNSSKVLAVRVLLFPCLRIQLFLQKTNAFWLHFFQWSAARRVDAVQSSHCATNDMMFILTYKINETTSRRSRKSIETSETAHVQIRIVTVATVVRRFFSGHTRATISGSSGARLHKRL